MANLILHEAAHVHALRRLGGNVDTLGLGLPLAPRVVLAPSRRIPFTVSISPWLIAAYVKPTRESHDRIARSRYVDRAWYAGAGVVANALAGLVLLTLLSLIEANPVRALACVALGVLLWVLRKPVVAYLLPVIGLAGMAAIGAVIVLNVGEPLGAVASAQALAVDGWRDTLIMAITVSFALALLNAIPMLPFDGGHVTADAIHELLGYRAAENFRTATSIVGLALMAYLLLSDLWLIT